MAAAPSPPLLPHRRSSLTADFQRKETPLGLATQSAHSVSILILFLIVRKEAENCDCLQGIRPGTPPDLRHWPAMVSPFCKWNCACHYAQPSSFGRRHTGKIPIHGDASAKATLYRDRFLLLLQRLSRVQHF